MNRPTWPCANVPCRKLQSVGGGCLCESCHKFAMEYARGEHRPVRLPEPHDRESTYWLYPPEPSFINIRTSRRCIVSLAASWAMREMLALTFALAIFVVGCAAAAPPYRQTWCDYCESESQPLSRVATKLLCPDCAKLEVDDDARHKAFDALPECEWCFRKCGTLRLDSGSGSMLCPECYREARQLERREQMRWKRLFNHRPTRQIV